MRLDLLKYGIKITENQESHQAGMDPDNQIATFILLFCLEGLDDPPVNERIKETISLLSTIFQKTLKPSHSQGELNDFKTISLEDFCIFDACIHVPWTRKQHQEWNKIWPMSFYGGNREARAALTLDQTKLANFYLDKLADDTLFPLLVFPEMKSNVNKYGCFGSQQINAFLVDPKTMQMIFKTRIHPLDSTRHPLDHACMILLHSLSTEIQSYSSGNDSDPFGKTKRKTNQDQYYCTGLDLYINHEPCMMCAMALVHSRIRMVFYETPDQESGALGSFYKTNICESLHHHFQVFFRTENYEG